MYLTILTSAIKILQHESHRSSHTLSHRLTHKIGHKIGQRNKQRNRIRLRLRDGDDDNVDFDAINAYQSNDSPNSSITTLYGEKLEYNEFA